MMLTKLHVGHGPFTRSACALTGLFWPLGGPGPQAWREAEEHAPHAGALMYDLCGT
jgi:hypothetical protein